MKIIETKAAEMTAVRELFLEYAQSLDFDLCFQDFDEELASLPGCYASPDGCILLARGDSGEWIGCVALRRLSSDTAEMKRLYVRPQYQRQGIGRALTTALIESATEKGYRKIRLDTVHSMKAAIRMYESMGFYPIPPYRENPVPGTTYLEKVLV